MTGVSEIMFIMNTMSENKTRAVFIRGMLILLMSVIFLTSAFSVAALNRTAVINVDGKTLNVGTITSDTDEILKNADISVSEYDKISSFEQDGVITVNVIRAFPVYVDNGTKRKYIVKGGTVGQLLKNEKIAVTENNVVFPDEKTVLKKDMTVKISEYRTVEITADGKTENKSVPLGNVKETLEYLNIKLGKNDTVSCGMYDLVKNGMQIKITRINSKSVTSTGEIPFETEEEYSDKLAEGKTKVKTKGVNGEYKSVVKQEISDGEVVSEECVSYEVTKEPVNEVVLIGTKKKSEKPDSNKSAEKNKSEDEIEDKNDAEEDNTSASVQTSSNGNVFYDANGTAVSYSTVYHGSGTAYYAPAGSLTASGNEVYVGGVAVNPDIIPYGTRLYIVADDGFVYGYATAIDTGGALYDGSAIVDVFYFTYDECVQFGRRDVSVYVLD